MNSSTSPTLNININNAFKLYTQGAYDPEKPTLLIDDFFQLHHDHIVRIFGDDVPNTVLMGMIGSEVGEAINEARRKEINYDSFGEELADILLRIGHFAVKNTIHLEPLLIKKISIQLQKQTIQDDPLYYRTPIALLSRLFIVVGQLVDLCEKPVLNLEKTGNKLSDLVLLVAYIGVKHMVDFDDILCQKLLKNIEKGNYKNRSC